MVNGEDNKCDEMTKILVNHPAPNGVVNDDNEVGMRAHADLVSQ